jgi:hypothetical protein
MPPRFGKPNPEGGYFRRANQGLPSYVNRQMNPPVLTKDPTLNDPYPVAPKSCLQSIGVNLECLRQRINGGSQ